MFILKWCVRVCVRACVRVCVWSLTFVAGRGLVVPGKTRHMLSIPTQERLCRMLQRLFDEDEFLSPFGLCRVFVCVSACLLLCVYVCAPRALLRHLPQLAVI